MYYQCGENRLSSSHLKDLTDCLDVWFIGLLFVCTVVLFIILIVWNFHSQVPINQESYVLRMPLFSLKSIIYFVLQ